MNSSILSVVIPTKNRPNLLKTSLVNFRIFSGEIDLIIIDDGSNQKNKKLNKEIVGSIGKYICNKNSLGGGAARNIGAGYSKSKYIWFVDDDDVVEKSTIIDVFKILNINNGFDVLLLPMMVIEDEKIKEVVHPTLEKNNYATYRKKIHQVNTSCTIMKRERFNQVGGWDANLVSTQDTDLFLRLSIISTYYYCLSTKPVIIQTSHADRITTNLNKRRKGSFQFLVKNWKVMSFRNILRYIKIYLKLTLLIFLNKITLSV